MPIGLVQFGRNQDCKYGRGVSHAARDTHKPLEHRQIVVRQPFKTRTHVVELIDFVQDSFESHECAHFVDAKGE
jgi:hypothetical protein